MKVFGIGLSRTGTTSLTNYLNRNGFNIIHYPMKREYIFGSTYDGATDIPVIPHYRKLCETFPDSKFIYTIRDKDEWLSAIEKYLENKKHRKIPPIRKKIRTDVYHQLSFDYNIYKDVFEKHESGLNKFFKDKPDRLLRINIVGGEDSSSLDGFLNIDKEPSSFNKDNSLERE